MYCRYCGYDLGDKETAPTYCPNCGAKVVKSETDAYNESSTKSTTYTSKIKQEANKYNDVDESTEKTRRLGRLFITLAIVLFFTCGIITIIIYLSGDIFNLRRLVIAPIMYGISIPFILMMLIFGIIYLRKKMKNAVAIIIFSILMLLSRVNMFRRTLELSQSCFYDRTNTANYYTDFFTNATDPKDVKVYDAVIDTEIFYTYIEFTQEENQTFYDNHVTANHLEDIGYELFGYSFVGRGDLSSKTFVLDETASSDVLFFYNSKNGKLVMFYIEMTGEAYQAMEDGTFIV
ncbi:zinc ribbon domain-containing protein [bacterium]|nr:zinc ribbon domain-containing protein [bacterium]